MGKFGYADVLRNNRWRREPKVFRRVEFYIKAVALFAVAEAIMIFSMLFVVAGIGGFKVGVTLLDAKTHVSEFMSSSKAADYDTARSSVDELNKDLEGIAATVNSPLWGSVEALPMVGGYMKIGGEILNLVANMSDSVVYPALDVLQNYPFSDLKAGDGEINVYILSAYINLLDDVKGELGPITEKLDELADLMEGTAAFDTVSNKLDEFNELYGSLDDFIPLAKAFIGDGSDKFYILAAQNSSEIRALGGFPGSVGTISISEGVLSIGSFTSVYDVFSYGTPADVGPTELEDELFGNWMHYPRDACFNPDFERVAGIWARAYENHMDASVDGVISVSPVIIQEILGVTGVVELSNGVVLDGNNATQYLQHDIYYQYLSGAHTQAADSMADGLFAETAKECMSRLTSNLELGNILGYLDMFRDGFAKRTVMMWLRNPEDEQYVKNVGASGNLTDDPENPVNGVFFSISHPCKLGWFLDIDYVISDPTKNEDGSLSYNVKVTLNNTIDDESKKNGSDYILGLIGGNINGFVHLFAPAGGKIGNFAASNNLRIYESEYDGLQVGYSTSVQLYQNMPVTIEYTVTTAPEAKTPLKVVTTPTLQEYRR